MEGTRVWVLSPEGTKNGGIWWGGGDRKIRNVVEGLKEDERERGRRKSE